MTGFGCFLLVLGSYLIVANSQIEQMMVGSLVFIIATILESSNIGAFIEELVDIWQLKRFRRVGLFFAILVGSFGLIHSVWGAIVIPLLSQSLVSALTIAALTYLLFYAVLAQIRLINLGRIASGKPPLTFDRQ